MKIDQQIYAANNGISSIEFSKYFYMLMLFLWCAYTAPFLKPFDSKYLLSSILYATIYFVYFYKYCLDKSNKPLIMLLLIFGCWYVAQCIKFGGLTSIDFRLVYSVVLCHISFYLYKGKEFFLYFEKVLVHLTILSLVVWLMAIFIPSEMKKLFDVISVWTNGYTTYGNIIVVALGNQYSMGILRNIGFTWEAGRFASFLVIGIFFNLLLHNMQLKRNTNFMILFLGLISTFSTTGVGALIGAILLWLRNQGAGIRSMFIAAMLCLIIPLMWDLEFVGGKIQDSADVEKELHNMHYSFEQDGKTLICPQRITGLYLEFQNWIHDFWLGYNLNENSYSQKVLFGGFEVWLSNGLIQIFSKYGLFIGLLFYFLMMKGSKYIIQSFNRKGLYLYAFTFVLLSISYDFWASGIFLYFNLYWLYAKLEPKCTINIID